ncbi:hypothetical protein WX73_02863 [Clostridium coskatii]|nr:hypothetical protein WX73_02863 [Clostridium coskatii]
MTLNEQRYMKTIISKEEKYRRNNLKRNKARRNEKGMTTRQQQKAKKVQEVKELYNKGLTSLEIAAEMNITKRYVNKIIADF